MGATVQGLTNVTGQRTDIGALATDHPDLHLHLLRVEVEQFNLVNAHGLGSQLMIAPLTSQFIRPVASHLTGREQRRTLHDVTHKLRQRLLNQFPGDMGRRTGLIHRVLQIETGGGSP